MKTLLNKLYLACGILFLFHVQSNAQELLNYPLDTVNGEEVDRYLVEKSIGLDRIGINFNVTQSQIMRFNPVTPVIETFKHGALGAGEFIGWNWLAYSFVFMIIVFALILF